jgi:hypothetical protein
MNKIKKGFIVPSAAITIKPKQVRFYQWFDRQPQIGDLVYGNVSTVGQHSSLENVSGRIHTIHAGTRAVFVYGNRYAPDYYEGLVPNETGEQVDLLSRSGMIGYVRTKSARVKDPTKIHVIGYVCDEDGRVLNTRSFPLILPKTTTKKFPRANMILVCGTSMNSGKSMAAAACCWALSSMGHTVRASKVTGTASLKDILHMNDAGASIFSDFTYLGYPSTYLLPEEEVIGIFNTLDMKHANNPKNFWVVEFADGINQRETSMLLQSRDVRSRIHKLILCSYDAFGTIGGLKVLTEIFGLKPHALSGICSSSPLHVREVRDFSDIPMFNSAKPDLKQIGQFLIPKTINAKAVLQNVA